MTTRLSPGEFRATCRKAEHVPFADVPRELLDFIDAGEVPERGLPDALRSYANGTGMARVTTTWDRKLKANVVALSCSFETTDRAEFVEHMATVHGRMTGRWSMSRVTENGAFSKQVRAGVPRTRRLEEGQPFKPLLKSIAEDLVTCDCCGLVMERRGDLAGERFVREHLAMCVGPVESVSA